MTQEEMQSKIEYLLKQDDITSKFIGVQCKINSEMIVQLTNHREVLASLQNSDEILKSSAEDLVQQDLNLLKVIKVIKDYLKVQQNTLNAFVNDYTEHVAKLTDVSPKEIIQRIEKKSTVDDNKSKLFVVRD